MPGGKFTLKDGFWWVGEKLLRASGEGGVGRRGPSRVFPKRKKDFSKAFKQTGKKAGTYNGFPSSKP